jgi:hypothetical protein
MDRETFERIVDDVLESLPQWVLDRVDQVKQLFQPVPR